MKFGSRMPLLKNWKLIVCITLPFLLLPIAFLGESEIDSKRYRCAYTIILTGVFWMLEVMPLSVTSFLPVFFFPVFGIQSTGQVVANYMKETQMMFIGGISIALALRSSGLHKRIALRMMILIGSSPWRLLFGILVTTTVLSGIIVVNTAVAAMMSPIVVGLIEGLDSDADVKRKKKLGIAFMLAVGYGANIGGTSTIIGSLPAIIYKDLIEKENVGQHGKYVGLNFFTYSAFSIPLAVFTVLIVWLVLGFMFLRRTDRTEGNHLNSNFSDVEEAIRIPRVGKKSNKTVTTNELETKDHNSHSMAEEQFGKMLRKKYEELDEMGFEQYAILTILSMAVILWFTRDPQVFPGWLSLFPEGTDIGDSSVAIAALILLFIVPRKIKYFRRNYEGRSETLLTWSYIHENYPWNVIFIAGGGLAVSDGATKSGLSEWIGQELMRLESLPKPVILFILLIFVSIFTEFMSNAGTISLMTPILIDLSKSLNIHPLYLSFPGAIACQYSFVFPTSNPSNAIVYSAGKMTISDMAIPGIILNFICILVLYALNLTWGEYVLFKYRDYSYPNTTISFQFQY